MLQEADPTGEGYIRMEGGVPAYAIPKEGYWDGPYSYIDEEGNYVTSTKGYKIDVGCTDIDSFVRDNFNFHDENNWEKIKSKIKSDTTYAIKKQRDERHQNTIKYAKECFDDEYEIHDRLYKNNLKKALDNAEKGWTWYQNKEVDNDNGNNIHFYYTWLIYNENGKQEASCVAYTEPIMFSNQWEKVDNNVKEGYYQWIKK